MSKNSKTTGDKHEIKYYISYSGGPEAVYLNRVIREHLKRWAGVLWLEMVIGTFFLNVGRIKL